MKHNLWVNIQKILLSLFVVYFCSMILIMANGSSYLGRFFQDRFILVANVLGLNTTWNFFSPDPAHVMWLKYIVVFTDDHGIETQDAIEDYYPPGKDSPDFGLASRRDSYAMRFLAVDSNKIETYFGPWMCKQHPGATRVRAELVINAIPTLDMAVTLKRFSFDEMMNENVYTKVDYDCKVQL